MEKHFQGFTVQHIARADNIAADAQAKAVAQGAHMPPEVFYHVTHAPAIGGGDGISYREVAVIVSEHWRSPIIAHLRGTPLPEAPTELRRLQHRCRNYTIVDGTLYKAGVTAPLLRCIARREGLDLLEKVFHAGACGAHASARALVGKVF
jgi:hypothetical protein